MSEEFLGGFIGGEIFGGVSRLTGLRANVPKNSDVKNGSSVHGDEVYYQIEDAEGKISDVRKSLKNSGQIKRGPVPSWLKGQTAKYCLWGKCL